MPHTHIRDGFFAFFFFHFFVTTFQVTISQKTYILCAANDAHQVRLCHSFIAGKFLNTYIICLWYMCETCVIAQDRSLLGIV